MRSGLRWLAEGYDVHVARRKKSTMTHPFEHNGPLNPPEETFCATVTLLVCFLEFPGKPQ